MINPTDHLNSKSTILPIDSTLVYCYRNPGFEIFLQGDV